MCGIVGIAGNKIEKQEREVFQDLLRIAHFRGIDATGIVSVAAASDRQKKKMAKKNSGLPMKYIKGAEPSVFFLMNESVQKFLNTGSSSALIGHTRAATVGDAHDDENAHPFDFDNVIGVHNGSMFKIDLPNGRDFETDTEAIYALLDSEGIDEGIKKLREIDRAPFALAFVNKNDNTLNFIRNVAGGERPLWFAQSEDGHNILWASEPDMLWFVAARHDYKLKPGFTQPKDGQLITFSLVEDNILASMKSREFARPIRKVPVIARPTNSNTHRAPYVGGDRGFAGKTGQRNGQTIDWRGFLPKGTPREKAQDDGVDYEAFGPSTNEWRVGGPASPFRDSEEEKNREHIRSIMQENNQTDLARDIHLAQQASLARENAEALGRQGSPEKPSFSGDFVIGVPPHDPPFDDFDIEEPEVFHDPPRDRKTTPAGQPVFRGPGGLYITADVFRTMAHECDVCGRAIDHSDPFIDEKIEWVKNDAGKATAVCEECVTEIPWVQDMVMK